MGHIFPGAKYTSTICVASWHIFVKNKAPRIKPGTSFKEIISFPSKDITRGIKLSGKGKKRGGGSLIHN